MSRGSFWKREIRLPKRSGPSAPSAAPGAADAKPSLWEQQLDLGGKDAPVEAMAVEPVQPTLAQPSLWQSPPPDSPVATHEVAAATKPPFDPAELDPKAGTVPEAPAGATRPVRWFDTPPEEPSPAVASSEPPPSGRGEAEDAPAAPGPWYANEPEWAAESEHAPFDPDQGEPEPATEDPYGLADPADASFESAAPTSTTGWPVPDRGVGAVAFPESTLSTPQEPAAEATAGGMFAFPPGAIERPEPEPVARWWDPAPREAETSAASEAEVVPANPEPESARAFAEPTWSRPAWPEAPAAESEPPAVDREPGTAAPTPAPAEQLDPAVAGGWAKEEPEPESEATAVDAEPEWQTAEQAAQQPPADGWERALAAPGDEAPAEPVRPVPDAHVAPTEVSAARAPKPSLLKRELRLPRPGRRGQKPSSPKASDPHSIKNIVGLRVGSSQLAAAHVHNNGAAEVVQIARTPLSRGIVAGGEVRDPEALTSALKKFFAEHKLPRRGIRLGIASNRIGVRILEVPALDDPRLFENSIRFHAQETLPISVSDAIIDHVVLGPGAGGGLEPMVRILLVFAHRELVDRHVQACRRAGLKLEGIDFEAFALLRALGAPRPAGIEATQAVVAVAIGRERTIFAVSDGRICDFTRVLEWGGGSLDVSIARALNLTPSQAEPLKLALSLDGDEAPSQLTPEQATAARAAVRTELQSLSRELVSSLQFYQARPGSLDIGEITLSGGGAQLDGLAGELERLVGVRVVTGDPFARVEVGRKVGHSAEAGSLAIAIGLGIED